LLAREALGEHERKLARGLVKKKKTKKKKKTGAGRDEQLELRSDGAQAHQCDALLRRELHKSSGAQPNHRVSIPHSPTASVIFLGVFFFFFFSKFFLAFSGLVCGWLFTVSLFSPLFRAGSSVLLSQESTEQNETAFLKNVLLGKRSLT
jgi:hypothetical protein